MKASVLREIDYDGSKLYTCPNGCDESELETGTEGQSFMAIMGKPHKYLRCGKCGFGEVNKARAKTDMVDVLGVWNETCATAVANTESIRWIAVSDELPDAEMDVLVCYERNDCEERDVTKANYDDSNEGVWWVDGGLMCFGTVLYWAEMPAGPSRN